MYWFGQWAVGFLCRKTFSPSIVSSPRFRSFEIIILSFKSENNNSFVAACVYCPPGSCTTQFLKDFLDRSGFLSSTGSKFIICCDINVHLYVECCDRSRFNNILQCCSLVQSVSCPTPILVHTRDVLLYPCDSNFDANLTSPTHQPVLKNGSLIISIIGSILTSSTMTLLIYRLYSTLKELLQNCMVST